MQRKRRKKTQGLNLRLRIFGAVCMKFRPWILALATGVLLWLGWPPSGVPVMLLFAWVPLLWAERLVLSHGRFLLLCFLSMLLWNTGSTWWVWYASPGGSIFMLLANSLLMTAVWALFRFIRKQRGEIMAYGSLPLLWLAFEYFHLNWQSAWPWLNLGNGLAMAGSWIQWYSFTGTLGGTLWIWLCNLFVFRLLLQYRNRGKAQLLRSLLRFGPAPLLVFLLPILLSMAMRPDEDARKEQIEVLILQPSFDPYLEKFERDPADQLREMLDTAARHITPETRIVLMPETALVGNLDEDALASEQLIQLCRQFLRLYPQCAILAGADTRLVYMTEQPPTHTARPTEHPRIWVDYFNTGLWLDTTREIGLFHKSKLVPGVEKMPYKEYLGFLEKLSIDMGGTSGSLGYDDTVRISGRGELKVGTAICYESVFGQWCAGYTRLGARLLAIATNDGWWQETDGHVQHLHYARLRAIENRRWVVRSANTGISAVIDPAGNITQSLGWYRKGVIKARVPLRDDTTFYTRHGDYLGRLASLLAAMLIAWALLGLFLPKRRKMQAPA
jgi:apolipoprotein N-acyltransferase